MSRFETSKFVRNNAVMNRECLIQACDQLGWKYVTHGTDELLVTGIGVNQQFYGEYALRVKGSDVTYNTYYLGNAREFVNQLQVVYNKLNVEYSKNMIVNQFKAKGFTYKSNDKFVETATEKVSFYMVGRSNDKTESEPVGQIKFTILFDGTVVSDSNYLPDDVNRRAHAAMDEVDMNFSSKRIMTKKEVPMKYRDRINKSKQIQSITQNK
ncbi:MAG: hypothetical protein J6Y55_01925 [Bacteroidales bacterium]|nr:hypothetical protein [Bacteroidales bacterium]